MFAIVKSKVTYKGHRTGEFAVIHISLSRSVSSHALACGSRDPSFKLSIKSLRICPLLCLFSRLEPFIKSSTLDDAVDRPVLPDRLRILFVPYFSSLWSCTSISASWDACAARRYERAASVFDQFSVFALPCRANGTVFMSLATEPQSLCTAPVSSRVRGSTAQQCSTLAPTSDQASVTSLYNENEDLRVVPKSACCSSSCVTKGMSERPSQKQFITKYASCEALIVVSGHLLMVAATACFRPCTEETQGQSGRMRQEP